MDSFEQVQEPQQPPKYVFYSQLTEEDIFEIDHPKGVQPLWHDRDYHNFYLLTDLLLLADEFKIFRDVSLQHYGLDPAHNYIFPGLSWQAALEWRMWNWTFSLILINIC